MKIETYCPLFPGFYNTMFEPDETNEIHSHNDYYGTDLNYDDFEWDYADYKERVATAFVDDFEKEFCDILPIKIKYQSISSPAYYNFSNDIIDIEVELDFNAFIKVVNEKKEEIRKYILDRYTSHDGFVSFHSNDVEDWCRSEYVSENKYHRVGALLEALLLTEFNPEHIYDWASSEMYIDYQVKCK